MPVITSASTLAYSQEASLVASGLLMKPGNLILPRILPIIPTVARQGFYLKETQGNIADHANTKRAPGGTFKRFDYKFTSTAYACESYGSEQLLPDEHDREWSPQFGNSLLARMAEIEVFRIQKDIEKQGADTLFNASTYTSGNSNGHAASNQWTASTGVPANDVATAKANLMGKYPGADVSDFVVVMDHALALETIVNTQIRTGLGAAFTRSGVAPAAMPKAELEMALAEALGVGEAIIGGTGYKSAGTDASPTYTRYWNPTYCGVGLKSKFVSDGFTSKFFQGVGAIWAWSEIAPAATGNVPVPVSVSTYRENPRASEVVQVATSLDLDIINSDAWYLITNCS